ncbi:RICIN domain-containing protein [Streptomyces sp. NPDC088261]|uniref:RICIN domain-containing protein n=1 Tax=Streptomyces sp. NPDC088261 TaxID=3365851 RepID=UPI003827A363
MFRSCTRALAAVPAVLALAATAVVATAGGASAAANPGPGFPAQYAAPYIETYAAPSAMANARNATGLKYFTLAFIIDGGGCNATYNGDTPLTDAGWTSAINANRAAGGDVIASFGGAAGTELAQACTSVAALKTQYKRVIDGLNLTRVDFDIEGDGVIDDDAANDRRNKALAQLQQEYAAAGRKLDVQFTLATDPTGLPQDQLDLLTNAKNNNLTVNLVNLMTMDYGPAMDMGKAATDAATALHAQLGRIWTTKTDAQLWAMEGNTPMIGVNDTTAEVFSTGNANTLAAFAKAKGIQELAFWALGRDKACASNGTLSDTCSGTSQSAWQFSSIFNGVTGPGGGTTPPPTGGATGRITGLGGKCVDVNAASNANGTAVQLYDCNGSTAQQWTVSTDGTVRALGKCLDLAAAGTANGTKAQLYDCNGTGAQQWQKGTGNTLVNPVSGKCLDVTDKSTANGARLQIWTCAGGTNQQFLLPA